MFKSIWEITVPCGTPHFTIFRELIDSFILTHCFLSLSLVKDTFKKYSSTDTDTYFQKYLKYVSEYLKKKYLSTNTNTFKKYSQILSNTFKYFFF